MGDVLKRISETGIVPVINITDLKNAVPLADALKNGEIPLIEITLRSECSLNAISAIKAAFPDMSVGAGTVLNTTHVDDALSAGADFIVSPGLNPDVVKYCQKKGVTTIPGCITPREVQMGLELGLTVFKFFPCEPNGGLKAISLLSSAFKGVRFLPTGGITLKNLGEYMACSSVIACGGSFMAPAEQINRQDFEGITETCRQAVTTALGFELAHIGINHRDADNAETTGEFIREAFRLNLQDGASSLFAGEEIELMKMPFYGSHGHIGFRTNSMERAMAYFLRKGIEINRDSVSYDENGRIKSAYLLKEAGGFALHITQTMRTNR